jgi:hypothetical protein
VLGEIAGGFFEEFVEEGEGRDGKTKLEIRN